MSYFVKLPYTDYEFNGDVSIIKDVLVRSNFITKYKPLSDIYIPYLLEDGETAQSVSLKFYSSVNYHWVIYIFNEIHDPQYDWPVSQRNLELLCIAKYGNVDMYRVRHHERDGVVVGDFKEHKKGFPWVPPLSPAPLDLKTIPISFYEYEQQLNDQKRQIRIMRPELLGKFVSQFEDSLNG